MSFVNICRDNTDPFYRYKMPLIQSKTEGRGNGIKTAILNLAEVARALGRPPAYLVKFFGSELGAQTSIDEKLDRYLVNGAHDSAELQDSLDGFINKFVLCGSCKNPETEIQVKGKDDLQRDCKACGKITMIDLKHKLSSYILKHPPTSKKGKKAATATANVVGGGKSISDIASGQSKPAAEDAEGNDDDDFLTKKINAEAAQLASVQVKDDEWAVDMSEEAIAARARELEGLTLNDDEAKFNDFGEWLLKESDESKEDLPTDVEIYKKIIELEISDKPETVQVLAQVLFDEDILNQIEPHVGLLAKLINGQEEFETAFLGGLERFLGLEKPDLIPAVPKILLSLYDKEIISEEVILSWGSKVSKKYVPKDVSKKVRKAAKPFIKWLEEADEESDEE
ncbi:eukaryotic translation initiation factor 5 [Suhomyces tanzawaensis NRRL Y-17324]|uniref:Eukaryotic translation initiation factor 5 n=1 Tax=Suhomyces tanzawaensis NRRL Y-17324 TaxID=984487 RepID=A0A1E4SGS9_9ASCO|nr:eukaryotic translation initiation factor 5 [Suhomyces tanzawaensis NRRL Y-17324]ODV78675.1 eukaryotic translation initiation factor 5 [Suhomyces tanzawaensis NRRL Y-17324]